MKIEIKLKNNNDCESCPCRNSDYEYGSSCNLGYWGDHDEVFMWINKKTKISQKQHPEYNDPIGFKNNDWDLCEVRPKKCIDENGF